MLVEARDVEEFEEDIPTRKPPRPQLRVRSGLDEEYSSDEIEKMTLLYEGTLSNIQEGEIVKSKVLRVTDTAVILDVGFKSEGAVAIDEFKDPKSLKEGDEVEVFLEHLEDQEGAVVLSKKKADFMRVWEKIREAFENFFEEPFNRPDFARRSFPFHRELFNAIRDQDAATARAKTLAILDIVEDSNLRMNVQSRLSGLANAHQSAVVCLTRKKTDAPSIGSLVSLRGDTSVMRTGFDEFTWDVEIVKDKRRGPGWSHSGLCRGVEGLH